MRVLIIGGGVGGLSVGIALRRAGWDVAVFERAPAFGVVGAGLTLWANAVKALDSLGLGPALRGGSQKSPGGGFHTWRGQPLAVFSGDAFERLTGAPTVAVHRAELIDLLADALGRDRVRLGSRFVEFFQTDGGVTARFDDGRVESGDLLVGADGLKSTVRAGLFGDQPPKYAGYGAWRGVTDFDTTGMPIGEFLGRGQRFGLVPLRGGRLYWFSCANLPQNTPPAADGHKTELLRRFGDWCRPIPDAIRRTDEGAILYNDIYDRDPADRWGEGRVTLLGDAAHPMTPNLGQGACQAIEDAAELGQCLQGVASTEAVPAALKRYEAVRIPRTRYIVRLSRQYGRFAQVEHPIGCWFRDKVMAWTPRKMNERRVIKIVNGR